MIYLTKFCPNFIGQTLVKNFIHFWALEFQDFFSDLLTFSKEPSITDGVHRNENLVKIIPVFSTFSTFFKKKKNYKSHFM